MSIHPRPWHRDSVFGDGPCRPLDREQRARFKFLLSAYYHSHQVTATFEKVGGALLRHLSYDGRCDPKHTTLADEAGCSTKTVERALRRFKTLGLVLWQHRIGRDRWRVYQRSNAYLLCPGEQVHRPTAMKPVRDRQSVGEKSSTLSDSLVPEADRLEAAQALARIRDRRQAVLFG